MVVGGGGEWLGWGMADGGGGGGGNWWWGTVAFTWVFRPHESCHNNNYDCNNSARSEPPALTPLPSPSYSHPLPRLYI